MEGRRKDVAVALTRVLCVILEMKISVAVMVRHTEKRSIHETNFIELNTSTDK